MAPGVSKTKIGGQEKGRDGREKRKRKREEELVVRLFPGFLDRASKKRWESRAEQWKRRRTGRQTARQPTSQPAGERRRGVESSQACLGGEWGGRASERLS